VGTLFGKTLDVDMAYTRKNKVLRTKIGCLDSRLIPKDSDMFIRRGFLSYLLRLRRIRGTMRLIWLRPIMENMEMMMLLMKTKIKRGK
jgi:hypothetical protein